MDSRDRSEKQTNDRRENTAVRNERCLCRLCFLILLAIVTAPYRRTFKLYTWRPLQEMRAAHGDRDTLVPLIRQWKVEKYEELRSVQVSVCLQDLTSPTATDLRRLVSALELHWQVCPGPKLQILYGLQVRFSSAVFSVRYGPSSLQFRPSPSWTICQRKRT